MDAAALKTTVVGAAAFICTGGCQRGVALPRGAPRIRAGLCRHAARRKCADGAGAARGGVCRRDALALQTSGLESDGLLQRSGDDDGHDRGALSGRKGGGLRFYGKHRGVAGCLRGARRRGGARVSASGTGVDEQAGAGAGFWRGDCGGSGKLRRCAEHAAGAAAGGSLLPELGEPVPHRGTEDVHVRGDGGARMARARLPCGAGRKPGEQRFIRKSLR